MKGGAVRRAAWFGAARRLRALEPALVLCAAPALLLTERLGPGALVAGLGWLAALWAVRRAVDGRWSAPLVVDAPVAALLLTVPGAVAAAADRTAAVSRAASLVLAVATAYAVAHAVTTPRRAWRIASWVLVGSAGLALAGALAVEWPDKAPLLGAWAARLPRLLPAIPHAVFGRAAGTAPAAAHPNMLAGLLIPFVPLAAACLLWPRAAPGDPRRMPRRVRSLAALALVAALPALALAQSRGAWAALGAALAWLLWRRAALRPPAPGAPRGPGRWAAGATAAALVVALALAAGRGATGAGVAAAPGALDLAGRLALWRASAALVAEHPATGIGLHQFALRFGREPGEGGYVYQGYAHAHNQLLQAALDYGLPGLAAVAGLYAALAVAYGRARRRTAGTPADALVVGTAAGLLAHALHGLVDAVAIGAKPGFTTWALVGLLAGARASAARWSGGERAYALRGSTTASPSNAAKPPGSQVISAPTP